jgi:hypothetical protein
MIWRLQRKAVIREARELFRRHELCVFVSTVVESTSDLVFAVAVLAFCPCSETGLDTYASNSTASIGRSGVDALSSVFNVASPPGLFGVRSVSSPHLRYLPTLHRSLRCVLLVVCLWQPYCARLGGWPRVHCDLLTRTTAASPRAAST